MSQPSFLWVPKSEVRDFIESVAIAVVISCFIMLFIARSCIVVGSSMHPTLENRHRLMVEKVSYRLGKPQRGDIIVFDQDWSEHPLIKRVIGLPGDWIEIRSGVLRVNGQTVDEPFLSETANEDYGPTYVPENSVFVLGDNRNNSIDSRFSVGFLPRHLIIGRALFRFWPLNKATLFRRPPDYAKIENTGSPW